MKILRLGLALVLALTLMTFASGTVFAGTTPVDQRAEITLLSKGVAMGDAELRLRIDEAGMLDLFRIKVDAEGLVPGGTYSLVLGYHVIATAMADGNGKISWDVLCDKFPKTTLDGLKVKVVYGTTLEAPVTLWGKVMASDIELEDPILP